MAQEQKQELKQMLKLTPKISKDLVREYIGKKVVLEEGNKDVALSSGMLHSYDGRFLKINDYAEHHPDCILSHNLDNTYKRDSRYDVTNQHSVVNRLLSRLINVNLIFSIQSLEELVAGREMK
ncbi:MAG: hypothetical protein AABX16_05520 [Nanoarchaeota archaeon]